MPDQDVTLLFQKAAKGHDSAVATLLPLVYNQLRGLAGDFFRAQTPSHTLQPTALVHEAYVKLVGARDIEWQSRAHFFAVAAKAMRQVLADHARRKKADKRGGDRHRVTLAGLSTADDRALDLADLHDALNKLADLDPRQYEIVELRFLGGMTNDEVAAHLDVSTSTVQREWRMARAWLRRELQDPDPT